MQRLYETKRLFLKVIDESYAERVLNYWRRNRIFLENWVPKKNDSFKVNILVLF